MSFHKRIKTITLLCVVFHSQAASVFSADPSVAESKLTDPFFAFDNGAGRDSFQHKSKPRC